MSRHPLFKAYAALVSVCFFWGTTYLGIRMALESFAPLVLVSARFLLSGSALLLFARLRGWTIPQGRGMWKTMMTGVLILGVGNSALTYAETRIPSGLAGLIITISPFWMVGLEALLPGGVRLHGPTMAGMGVGLAGAMLLLGPDIAGHSMNNHTLIGFLILQVGMASWSFGSIYQRRQPVEAHAIVVGALHQLAAGVAFLPLALVVPHDPIVWTTRGVGALAYLVVFGSIVGYTSYAYILEKLPVAMISVHSYVNSVVAVTLGWLVYREPFGWREGVAMAVIFAGVAIVKRYSVKTAPLGAIPSPVPSLPALPRR